MVRRGCGLFVWSLGNREKGEKNLKESSVGELNPNPPRFGFFLWKVWGGIESELPTFWFLFVGWRCERTPS